MEKYTQSEHKLFWRTNVLFPFVTAGSMAAAAFVASETKAVGGFVFMISYPIANAIGFEMWDKYLKSKMSKPEEKQAIYTAPNRGVFASSTNPIPTKKHNQDREAPPAKREKLTPRTQIVRHKLRQNFRLIMPTKTGWHYIDFPKFITVEHIAAFWRVTVVDKNKPLDKYLCDSAGPFTKGTRGTLYQWRNFYYRRGWGVPERKGPKSAMILTDDGVLWTRIVSSKFKLFSPSEWGAVVEKR